MRFNSVLALYTIELIPQQNQLRQNTNLRIR